MKILLGIPCGGTVKTSLLTTVVEALFHAPCPIVLMVKEGCLVHESRNEMARQALIGGFTHLWMVDSDIEFSSDTLSNLLKNDKDIVGAAYNYRTLPLHSTVKMKTEAGFVEPEEMPKVPFACHSLGTGCILIKTEVFKKIPVPWFNFSYDNNGMMTETEDTYFCRQASESGIETWCDPTIKIGHIGDYVY